MRSRPAPRTLHLKLMVERRSSGEKTLVRLYCLFLLAALAVLAAACGGATQRTDPARARRHSHHSRQLTTKPEPVGPFAHPLGRSHLAPGSDPSVLPGDVLIADRSNNRLLVVDPRGRIVWRFPQPGNASLPI
ncbi:MAG TPA: hypothetical protein VKB70_00855, partial [Gaiellaceae bacterium]|nr:hypothetical protein [Gaiellaceae bacterium]